MEALEVGCVAPVCGGSQGGPGQCCIAIAFCFIRAEWKAYCVVVVVHERGSWDL